MVTLPLNGENGRKGFDTKLPQQGWGIINRNGRYYALHLIGSAGQEIFDILSVTGENYESAIANLDSYFMPKRSLIYERYNFLSARQKSAETIDVYLTRVRLLTKSCDYGGFKKEMIRDHVVMSCVSSRLRRHLLWEKDLSLELLQKIARTMKLSDHQA